MTLDQIKKYRGLLLDEDVDRLHWLGKQVPAHGLVVEVGPYRGKSTAAILSGLADTARLSAIWRAWLPFCKGWIASHDYIEDKTHKIYYPGVHQILDKLVKPITTDHHHVGYMWSGKIKEERC